MLSRSDPRIRRALDQTAQNLEVATERTREGIYSFTQRYITPCFTATAGCLHQCTGSCFPRNEDRRRRQRERARGRAEFSFDFYDDWEEEETEALLGFGEDDFNQPSSGPAPREQTMDYGTRHKSHVKSTGTSEEGTKTIPSSSYFGFLNRLPFKIGNKNLKYKPSVADLQDHPASRRPLTAEEEPLLDSDPEDTEAPVRHKRSRSGTQSSGRTSGSLSSRGDIFPSDDEMDDAVPLDDEFALQLERRTTGSGTEDDSSGKGRTSQNRSTSHLSVFTLSSKGNSGSHRSKPGGPIETHVTSYPSLLDDKSLQNTKDTVASEQFSTPKPESGLDREPTNIFTTPHSPPLVHSISSSTNGSISLPKTRHSSTGLPQHEVILNEDACSSNGEVDSQQSGPGPQDSRPNIETFNAARLPRFV